MVVDHTGKEVPHFVVTKPWDSKVIFEDTDLGLVCKMASAISMYRGIGTEVARVVPDGSTQGRKATLIQISASSIDWRRVAAEHALLVKQFAFDLAPNIEEISPSVEKEGSTG